MSWIANKDELGLDSLYEALNSRGFRGVEDEDARKEQLEWRSARILSGHMTSVLYKLNAICGIYEISQRE